MRDLYSKPHTLKKKPLPDLAFCGLGTLVETVLSRREAVGKFE